jgi:hypothetical protein
MMLILRAGTIRVDESADQRTYKIGPCKNAAAYRTVLLGADGKIHQEIPLEQVRTAFSSMELDNVENAWPVRAVV